MDLADAVMIGAAFDKIITVLKEIRDLLKKKTSRNKIKKERGSSVESRSFSL